MKVNYTPDNPRGDNPLDAYFTKAEELNNPTNPADGKTGNIVFTLNEKWAQPEHMQSHIVELWKLLISESFCQHAGCCIMSMASEILCDMKQKACGKNNDKKTNGSANFKKDK